MSELAFWIVAAVALGGALGVVASRSPVASLLFMVTTLAGLAAAFVLLEAHFLAAIQVIVYAGAIMVLFLFVIMLLNLGHDRAKDLKFGVLSVLAFVAVGGIAGILATQLGEPSPEEMPTAGAAAIDAAMAEHGAVGAIAHPLYTDYVLAFEVVGILLLVAIVGALALGRRSAR